MPEHIFAWCDTGWNGRDPGEVIRQHVVRRPVLWTSSDHTCLIDFGELQSSLVDRGTIIAAGSKVIEHRAFMRIRPCIPHELDGGPCIDCHILSSRYSIVVADDVLVGQARCEAIVAVVSQPTWARIGGVV